MICGLRAIASSQLVTVAGGGTVQLGVVPMELGGSADCATMTREVIAGSLANGLALLRPPGHHAERDRAMGFCLFNNVAVAAAYLRVRHGIERVLVVDWDVHHGNGTQDVFYDDGQVVYASVHEYVLVALTDDGDPKPVPGIEPESDNEKRRQREAQLRRDNRLRERDEIRRGRDE